MEGDESHCKNIGGLEGLPRSSLYVLATSLGWIGKGFVVLLPLSISTFGQMPVEIIVTIQDESLFH